MLCLSGLVSSSTCEEFPSRLSVVLKAYEYGCDSLYQVCCLTQKKPKDWNPIEMIIWDKTEKRRAPDIRPEGGLCATSSFQAGFKLTTLRRKRGKVCI